MTIYTTSVRLHAQRLTSAREQAATLARNLQDALARAQVYHDPDLSEQGISAKRQELTTTFREAARTDLAKLRAELTGARDYLRNSARENLPTPTDAASLIRADQKWRNVERVLDAGGNLRDAITKADVDTALAIAEFGPSWLEANVHRTRPTQLQHRVAEAIYGQQRPDPTAWLIDAVYVRVAQVTADAALAELLLTAAQADGQYTSAQPWLDAAQAMVDHGSGDMLGAAIASHVAAGGTASDQAT